MRWTVMEKQTAEEVRKKVYTIEDIYALPVGERAELIDGQIYSMAPPSWTHQKIFSIHVC